MSLFIFKERTEMRVWSSDEDFGVLEMLFALKLVELKSISNEMLYSFGGVLRGCNWSNVQNLSTGFASVHI